MMIFKKNKNFFLAVFLVFILFVFFFAGTIKGLEADWPPAPGGKTLTDDSHLVDFIEYVYLWALLLGGLFAFFILIFGGFKYLTSIGDPMKINEAKERIISAIIGLVLLLSSYLILNTLNPELTTLSLPTTTVPSLGTTHWGNPNIEEPCEWVDFFSEPNFQGELWNWDNRTTHSFDAIYHLDPPTKCKDFGWSVGWTGGGEAEVPKSVKVKGACQINLYQDVNCKGSYVALSRTQGSLAWISLNHVHSARLVDFSPPGVPIVKNNGVTSFAPSQNPDGTCNVTLHGTLEDLRRAGSAKVFFEYGKTEQYLENQTPLLLIDREELFDPGDFAASAEKLSTSSLYYYHAAAFSQILGTAPVATFTLDANCNITGVGPF